MSSIAKHTSEDDDVKKFVFTTDDAVYESVLYKYPDFATRTVVCCSVMSGCPVGCKMCGTGSNFVKRATTEEILWQVDHLIRYTGVEPGGFKRLQVMFMAMGEPMLNRAAVEPAIRELYKRYPTAELLVSTVGPKTNFDWLNQLSVEVPTVGLQFSVHESNNFARNKLIPFKNKLSLSDIASLGDAWYSMTGRKPCFNYCIHDKNNKQRNVHELLELFDPVWWDATVSVVCDTDEYNDHRTPGQQLLAAVFSQKLEDNGYNVRVFDPAGQDDIGGGCGQLWFVQQWMNEHKELVTRADRRSMTATLATEAGIM